MSGEEKDFGYTAEQKMFRKAVASFVSKEIAPYAREWDESEKFPLELFEKLGKLGYLGVGFPEDVGGSGGGPVEYTILMEELARASAGIALGIYVHTGLACAAIYHLGNDEQKRAYLPDALKGEKKGCWAYAEPGAGADVTSVSLKATPREDGGYVLDGSKLYITNGAFADFAVVVGRSDPDSKGLKGLSLFIVDTATEGFIEPKAMDKLGVRCAETAELLFEECHVPATNLLGSLNKGLAQALKVLTLGRIGAASFAVGLAGAALAKATEYVKERQQFGGPLIMQQSVRFTLADMFTRIRASKLMVLHAAKLADMGLPHDTEAGMAKLFATEACTWACERALHLSGAFGYMMESDVQRFYRDCKVLEFGEGINEIQREMISKHLIETGYSGEL